MALIKSRKDIEIVFLYGVPFSCSALLRKQTIDISLGAGHHIISKAADLARSSVFQTRRRLARVEGVAEGVWPTSILHSCLSRGRTIHVQLALGPKQAAERRRVVSFIARLTKEGARLTFLGLSLRSHQQRCGRLPHRRGGRLPGSSTHANRSGLTDVL